jgi:hypothetical protein
MLCWTLFLTTLGSVPRVVSALCATILPGMFSTPGPSVLDCSQRKSAVACCSLTVLMGQAEDGGPLTFLFLPT